MTRSRLLRGSRLVELTMETENIIGDVLDQTGIKQGIIGVLAPYLGTVEEMEFYRSLFGIKDVQLVILPPPDRAWFDKHDKGQMDALAGRIVRDKTDGIRYNRIYVAIYDDALPQHVKEAHDVFVYVGPYPIEITVEDFRDGK